VWIIKFQPDPTQRVHDLNKEDFRTVPSVGSYKGLTLFSV